MRLLSVSHPLLAPAAVLLLTGAAVSWMALRPASGDEPVQGMEQPADWVTELELPNKAGLRRIAAKEQIVNDLESGRIGLLEAASRFRQVSAEAFYYLPVLRRRFPDAAHDDERICRNVIQYTYNVLHFHHPWRAEALCTRLEAELAQHLNAGTLRLPVCDASE
jgi:hypothetical protein